MALYNDTDVLQFSASQDFHKIHAPGQPVPHSGIYRCEGCGWEIAAKQNEPLPAQNHHQHQAWAGAIRWRMVVYAVHKG